MVIQRVGRDQVESRIVWKGGETTAKVLPIPVGSLADLAGAAEMEQIILDRSLAGESDAALADYLTQQGYRSPMSPTVLPSTVKIIRLRHGVMQKRRQSHPRHIAGHVTVSQIATALDLTSHWIYDRIHNGTIQIAKDPATKLYLFPDQPTTLVLFQRLRNGDLQTLRFSTEYQDA